MANTMEVSVVSAESELVTGTATEVYARSLEGEIGILPGHQPALLALDTSAVKVVFENGEEKKVAVHKGFLYFKDNELVILADIAELPEDIDVPRAERRKQELEKDMDREDAEVRASLKKQELRISMGS